MKSYFLSSLAYQDLDEIVSHYAPLNPNVASKLLESVYQAMDTLANNPMMGHLKQDITSMPVRFWTFQWHYLIVYTCDDPIEIVRILSGYRDLARLLI